MTPHLLLASLLFAACGDRGSASEDGHFEIVGHNDLGARGMNAAIALAGDVAYVGARNDSQPVLILDISDPADPRVVGELGPPDEGLEGMSSRELRAVADLDLLVVLNLKCSVELHGCAVGGAEIENLKFFDISERLAPRHVGTHTVQGQGLRRRNPHEFFLWRDPADRARVLVLLAAPGAPSLEVISVTAGLPTSVMLWDPFNDGGLMKNVPDSVLHSISASDDGRTAYASHQTGGLFALDLSTIVDGGTPSIAMLTPPAQALKFGVMGPHSAVPVPGRDLLVMTEEVYPPPYGAGCPWGHVRLVDTRDLARPVLAGEYRIAENELGCVVAAPNVAYTAHNATATRDVALVTWYAGGLHAIDISDPANPVALAELRPDPLPTVAVEDPGLGGSPIHMWSYPVIQDGLIYVIDSRNGFYVLRYHGRFAEQIAQTRFREGNSNL
jgi:hypothetical protein